MRPKEKDMKEFMLFIRNEGNPVVNLSPEQLQEHVQKVGGFIKTLVDEGKMKDAQPLEIAKSDPRFEDGEWRIEVRPIMKVEGIN